MKEMFFECYPGAKTYMEQALEECRLHGYIKTIFGRRRYLRDICSRNYIEKAKAQRQVLSSICQGSAADIIKVAMVEIMKDFRVPHTKR